MTPEDVTRLEFCLHFKVPLPVDLSDALLTGIRLSREQSISLDWALSLEHLWRDRSLTPRQRRDELYRTFARSLTPAPPTVKAKTIAAAVQGCRDGRLDAAEIHEGFRVFYDELVSLDAPILKWRQLARILG